MKTFKTLALASSLSAAVFASAGAMAATDATELGSISEGKFDIKLSISDQARIWGLDDVNLTVANNVNGTPASMSFCVFSNHAGDGSNLYDLDVVSENGFKMVNVGTGDAVDATAYKLTFTDAEDNEKPSISADDTIELDAGSLSTQPDPLQECPDGIENQTTVDIQFTGNAASVNTLTTGAYFDVVTLTVYPK